MKNVGNNNNNMGKKIIIFTGTNSYKNVSLLH